MNSDYELDLAGYNRILCNSSPLRSQRSLRKNGVCFEKHHWQGKRKKEAFENLKLKWSRTSNLKLIVCGSAASWILEKLIQAKGGLHNRITDTIQLQPFTLGESSRYLMSRGVKLNPMQIQELYMVMGGIPHYLRQIEKGKSSTQIINSLCFHNDGFLFTKFDRLFQSLFDHAEVHNKIICEIGEKRNGILRKDLLEATGYKSGGTFKKRLQELKESGFVQEFIPYGKARKDFAIKIVDEYTLFFLNWIKPVQLRSGLRYNPNYWLNLAKEPQYRIWTGYAFEAVCMKHIDQIMITTIGLKKNFYSEGLVDSEVVLKDLII